MRAPGRRAPPLLSLPHLLSLSLSLSLWLAQPASCGPAPRPTLVHRHHHGDMVVVAPGGASCDPEECSLLGARPSPSPSSSAPAPHAAVETSACACRCPGHAPAFREDLAACVADIKECPLVEFRSPSGPPQKLPFAFLPLRGQIVHPSASIALPDPDSCPVVGWRSLGLRGWSEAADAAAAAAGAFALFTVDGSVFLQWLGAASLRSQLGGRLVVVSLGCGRCVALRVAGSVTEPSDSSASEAHLAASAVASGSTVLGADLVDAGPLEAEEEAAVEQGGGSTYLAVGAAGGALAAAYVLAVLLYLARHRRRAASRRTHKDAEAAAAAAAAAAAGAAEAEAAAARRPPLQLRRHHSFSLDSEDTDHSGGGCSDYDEHYPEFKQVEAALLEPSGCLLVAAAGECLPQEALHIVETADLPPAGGGGGGARHPGAAAGAGAQEPARGPPAAVRPLQPPHHRRRLYFNPAFFEPDMLKSPPLAALEFLSKLREVVSLSKSRLAARRFSPCLMPIAEGDDEGPPAAVPALLKVETSDSEARRLMNEVLRELRQAAAGAVDRGSSPAAPREPVSASDTTLAPTPAATPSPTATLPLDEEMTAANHVLPQPASDHAGTTYNLISEIYVNGSADHSPGCEQQTDDATVTYQGQLGHLTIQVEDNPADYEYNPDDYSSFEPDTLDRKVASQQHKAAGTAHMQPQPDQDTAVTSQQSKEPQERPAHILLRTSGSFRSDSITRSAAASPGLQPEADPAPAPFTRAYGSLREIFEARARGRERRASLAQQCPHLGSQQLQLEAPPPLPPKMSAPIYQAPCWPARPVLPAKGASVTRSHSLTNDRSCGAGRTTWARRATSPSPSSDSLDSGGADADADYEECDITRSTHQRLLGSWSPATPQESHSLSPGLGGSVSAGSPSDSEAEGSLCDGASESGGESVATDSVFFGSFRKVATCVATVPDDRLREALSGLAVAKRHRS